MLLIETANMLLSEEVATLKDKFETYLKSGNLNLKFIGLSSEDDMLEKLEVFYSLKNFENTEKQNITIHFTVDRLKMEGDVALSIDFPGQKHKEYKLGTYHLWSAKDIDDLAQSSKLYEKIKQSILDYNTNNKTSILDKITSFFKRAA